MIKKSQKFQWISGFVAASLLTVVLPSEAKRFIVMVGDKETFEQTHQQVKGYSNVFLSGVVVRKDGQQSVKPFSKAKVKVEDSLENLSSLVVNVDDDSEGALLALKANPAVTIVEEEIFHPLPKPVRGQVFPKAFADVTAASVLSSATPWGILAVKAPQAWRVTQGQGARTLILDTGVDKDHPALAANFESGKDFVGDNISPYPFFDQLGHGSHVAGTIAGAALPSGFVGVAPQSKFLMGRVCAKEGCSSIAIAQGINWGIAQRVDLISMSLGGPIGTAVERRAVEAADKAGITVVAASGNDSSATVSYPAKFPSVIAVGALDSKMQKASFSQYGPELSIAAPGVSVTSSVPQGTGRDSQVTLSGLGSDRVVASTSFIGSPDLPQGAVGQLVLSGLGKPEDFKTVNVRGKFALIQRGEIPFTDKVQNAINAGASGVVIYNNQAGLVQGALSKDGTLLPIPVAMIEQTSGEEVKRALAVGRVVSAKVATVPTDYASMDGTSMATPHVAGVVALMKSANKNLRPSAVKQLIRSTAVPLGPNDQNQLGAGLIDAEKSVGAALNAR